MEKKFLGNFTQQEPLPESSIEAAIKVMRHGRLHRYNVKNGEISETALFEKEFAKKLDVRFCLACASGGYAMTTALRALGIKPGDKITVEKNEWHRIIKGDTNLKLVVHK